MKNRRKFIKTIAVGAGAISLPAVAQAQSTTVLPGVYSILLTPQIVTSGVASVDVYISSGAIVDAAASASVSIGIAPAPV